MKAELWHHIRELHQDKRLSRRAIARRLGIHRRTVRKALNIPCPGPETRPRRGSIIDPYRGWLLGKLEQYPEITAKRLLEMLRERGYPGKYSTVRTCVAELRPRLKQAYFTLNFPPGECAQVDWGMWKGVDVVGGRRMISFFAMVLCHSRMLYVELFQGQAMEHWLTAHRHAFEAFGGVPRKVMVDNCKTAVITPASGGSDPVFNPTYLEFAGHYGFRPVACTVRRPNEKGRVEQAVGYVKSAFFAGRDPIAPEVLAPALSDWLETQANVRIHGTTRRRPVDLFTEVESEKLLPLPAGPHSCASIRPVMSNNRFRISVDTNRYSVPSRYASQRLGLHLYADRVAVYTPCGTLIADHPRSYGRHQDILNPDHERELALATRHRRDRRLLEHFLALGSAADAYLTALQDRRPDWRSHIRRINALAESYGRDRVARLLTDALEHNAFSSSYILNILEAVGRTPPEPGALHVTRRSDLLDLDLPKPDLTIYTEGTQNDDRPAEESPAETEHDLDDRKPRPRSGRSGTEESIDT